MTLTSSIIQRAYRESNLIPLGATPSTAQITEGLDRLNSLLLSTVGNEVGDELIDITIGGDFDASGYLTTSIPDNCRLLLTLSATTSYNLDPNPEDGQRVAIVDVGSNLATYNLTLNGNGRLIETATTAVLSTDDLTREWMYRADTGNWVRVSSLASSDEMPFPVSFDEYFVTMLALRINPLYGQMLTTETLQALKRSRNQLISRYSQTKQVRSDVPLRGLATERDYDSTSGADDFAIGRTSWQ